MSDPKNETPVPQRLSAPRIQERLHKAKEMFEAGGVDFPGVGGLLYVWRKLGLKGTLLIILLVGFPLGEYSVLRSAVHFGVPRTVGGFGLEFEAEEWALAPLSLKATARNVRLRDPSDEQAVLTAGEVEFKGSLWTFLRGLPDMVTFHFFGGHQPFNEIIVRHAELHLERSLSGHLNWDEFVEAVPEERLAEAVEGVYQVHSIRFEDSRITYVENIPGGSGEGIIKTAQAQVKIDEIKATILNLVQPVKTGERPTSFKISGRSADGVFDISGKGAFFPSKEKKKEPESEPNLKQVSLKSSESHAGDYPYELSVYLENIAAGAYGRMIPTATIIPVSGMIGGTVKLIRVGENAECEGGLTMKDVRFAPNPLVLTRPSDVEVIQQQLVNLPSSGPFELCDDNDKTRVRPKIAATREPPASMVLTRFTEQATAGASPGIKALVARDRQSLRGEKTEFTISELTNSIAGEIGKSVARSLSAKTGVPVESPSGNALTTGLKGVGSGIKRLFGGK